MDGLLCQSHFTSPPCCRPIFIRNSSAAKAQREMNYQTLSKREESIAEKEYAAYTVYKNNIK
jgi:hypothetical protein